MLKVLTFLAIFGAILNSNFLYAQPLEVLKTNTANVEQNDLAPAASDSAVAAEGDDLKASETFGFGYYYPGFYGGGGYYPRHYGEGIGYGYGGGWKNRWNFGYGGYRGGYYRPVYPVWG